MAENQVKNTLSDFDICELFIKCVGTYVETSSKLEIERGRPLELGKELWKETIRTLKDYRESNRKTSNGM